MGGGTVRARPQDAVAVTGRRRGRCRGPPLATAAGKASSSSSWPRLSWSVVARTARRFSAPGESLGEQPTSSQALGTLLEFLLAAGLLRLGTDATWSALLTAVLVIAVRKVVVSAGWRPRALADRSAWHERR